MDFVDNNIQKVQVQPEDQIYAKNEDIKVYGKLVSMSTENVVADSEQIWDKGLKKNQSDINSVTQSKFGQYLPLAGGRIDGDLGVTGRVDLGGPLTIALGINAGMVTVSDGNNSANFTPTSIELGTSNDHDETHVTAKTINTNEVLLRQSKAHGTATIVTSVTPGLIKLSQTPGSARHVTTIQPIGISSAMFKVTDGTDQDVLLGDGSTTDRLIKDVTAAAIQSEYNFNFITTGSVNKFVTIKAATSTTAGVMTAADKTKLDDVPNIYAEKSKTISNITVGNRPNKRGLYIAIDYADRTNPGTTVNIPNATTTSDGCMSYEDKNKLDNIENTYLPLSGGTVTGGITVDGAINTKSNITTDGTVTAKGFVSKTEKNPHEVWACNGNSINLKTLIAATAVYVHGSIVESIVSGSINSTVTIEDPDAIVFNKATGSFLAKKGNGYYRYWETTDNLLISDSDKYGFLTTKRGTVPYHNQLYTFANDNNIYIANNTGSVSILDVYIN